MSPHEELLQRATYLASRKEAFLDHIRKQAEMIDLEQRRESRRRFWLVCGAVLATMMAFTAYVALWEGWGL